MYLCVYEWWHVCTVYVCKCYECKLINEAKGLKVMRLYFKTNLCSNIKKYMPIILKMDWENVKGNY